MPLGFCLLIPFRPVISILAGDGLQPEDPPQPKMSINHCTFSKGALLF
jgi:hypothetical protein